MGTETVREVQRLLKESIEYGLAHRADALQYALQYGRDLNDAQADKFVGMYVNDWTLDFGPRGRAGGDASSSPKATQRACCRNWSCRSS